MKMKIIPLSRFEDVTVQNEKMTIYIYTEISCCFRPHSGNFWRLLARLLGKLQYCIILYELFDIDWIPSLNLDDDIIEHKFARLTEEMISEVNFVAAKACLKIA
jgi:hypothetical protein